jgi:hypothetical protein
MEETAGAEVTGRQGGRITTVQASLQKELLDQLDKLSPQKQRRVLEFARSLSRPRGMTVDQLYAFAGSISPEDLKLMEEAIEEGCEQIEPDEW